MPGQLLTEHLSWAPAAGDIQVSAVPIYLPRRHRNGSAFVIEEGNLPELPSASGNSTNSAEDLSAILTNAKAENLLQPEHDKLRPSVEAIVREAGPKHLGHDVEDLSRALRQLQDDTQSRLVPERISTMTAEDVPEVLTPVARSLQAVLQGAAAMRHRLEGISEASSALLGKAAAHAEERMADAGSEEQAEGVAPEGVAPEGVAPEGVAPEGQTPEGLAPQGVAPEGVAPEGAVPQGLAPGGVAPVDQVKTGAVPLPLLAGLPLRPCQSQQRLRAPGAGLPLRAAAAWCRSPASAAGTRRRSAASAFL